MIDPSGPRMALILACGLWIATACGCADMDILPYWFPFQGPPSDRVEGVKPPAERITEVQKLSEKAAQADPREKQRISRRLAASIQSEKDPLVRVAIIRALGDYPGPEAEAILKAALADSDVFVRKAACESWGRIGNAQAVTLLSDTLRGDVDPDVRLAAAKALGQSKNPAAATALGEALSDADPAMQYRAALSLDQVTGKNFGGSVTRWQRHLRGEPPEPPASLAERFRQMF